MTLITPDQIKIVDLLKALEKQSDQIDLLRKIITTETLTAGDVLHGQKLLAKQEGNNENE